VMMMTSWTAHERSTNNRNSGVARTAKLKPFAACSGGACRCRREPGPIERVHLRVRESYARRCLAEPIAHRPRAERLLLSSRPYSHSRSAKQRLAKAASTK
jgi:hypothetical protein